MLAILEQKDIEAALDYLYNMNGNKPIILVGSSYSASLALWIATENEKIKAVAAFSPGEYLKNLNLAEKIKNLDTPTFVTSSKRETNPVEKLVRFVNKDHLTHYKPTKKVFMAQEQFGKVLKDTMVIGQLLKTFYWSINN